MINVCLLGGPQRPDSIVRGQTRCFRPRPLPISQPIEFPFDEPRLYPAVEPIFQLPPPIEDIGQPIPLPFQPSLLEDIGRPKPTESLETIISKYPEGSEEYMSIPRPIGESVPPVSEGKSNGWIWLVLVSIALIIAILLIRKR